VESIADSIHVVWVKVGPHLLAAVSPVSYCWPVYHGLPIIPPTVNSAGRMYVVPLIGSDGLPELENVETWAANKSSGVESYEHVVKRLKTSHVQSSHLVCPHHSVASPGAKEYWTGFDPIYWLLPKSEDDFYFVDPAVMVNL
jgi:hypothetical protein